jgi:hypothetical protein
MIFWSSGFREKNPDPRPKIDFFLTIFFPKNSKKKYYYAKWTLRIEVVYGKKMICYCIFRVYLLTGTKNPNISQEGAFRNTKLFFYNTTRGTLKDGQTQFLRIFLGTHIVSQAGSSGSSLSRVGNIRIFIRIFFLKSIQYSNNF